MTPEEQKLLNICHDMAGALANLCGWVGWYERRLSEADKKLYGLQQESLAASSHLVIKRWGAVGVGIAERDSKCSEMKPK